MGFLKPAIDWLESQGWGPFDFIRAGILTLLNILDPIVTALVSRAEAFINKLWELDLRIFSFIVDTLDRLRIGFAVIWDEIVYLTLYAADKIRELIDVWFDKIKEAIETIIPNLTEKVNNLINKLSDLGEGIISDVQTFLKTTWPAFNSFVNASLAFLTDFVKFLDEGLKWLENKINEVSKEFEGFLQTSWRIFTTNTTNFINALNQAVFNVVIPSLQNIYELFWGFVNDFEAILQTLTSIRKKKPKEVPTVHLSLTEHTPTKMGVGKAILSKIGEIFLEVIIWIIASFAIDVVIDWIFGDYDLETGKFENIPIEMTGFLEWNVNLVTGEFEVKTPITTTPIVPMIWIQRGGGS